ncbi:MAG: glycosyltransferase family 9 protein [Halothiobacillaceae bacterium]|nr:MAG: glycosyltransferase family 9 protein [Halothiobacillaceae bacterium]
MNRPYLPRTVILQHDLGIGDLIFRLPYIRAVAEKSKDGKVTLIARPTCRAHDLLRAEPCIETIIDYDRWRKEDRRGSHRGPLGFFRLVQEVRRNHFERMVIFSDRIRYGLLAVLAGIPERIGYGGFGWNWPQRFFLNRKPYIHAYHGPCISNYQWATELAIRHGFATTPLIPRLHVPAELDAHWAQALAALPQKRFVLAMGASVKTKDWGWQNFAMLAERLLREGHGVICLGGRAEEPLLAQLRQHVPPELHDHLRILTPPSVLDSAAIARQSTACVGNDTGMIHVAAACEVPTVLLLGHRPRPCHDPAMHALIGLSVGAITVEDVLESLSPFPVT